MSITVNITEDTITVTPSENNVTVTVSGAVIVTTSTKSRVQASSFSGADGDTGRAYTHSGTINSHLLFINSNLLDASTEYSLSTVTNANDTITITGALFDDEVVFLWE